METMQPVECGACGWTGRRKTGNVVTCPKCGAIAGFAAPLDPVSVFIMAVVLPVLPPPPEE